MSLRKPQKGDKKRINGKMRVFNENSRWELDNSEKQQGVRKNQSDTIQDIRGDFAPVEEETISVLDPKFKDVLINRYDLDPREIDNKRADLMGEEQRVASSLSGKLQRIEQYKENLSKYDDGSPYQNRIKNYVNDLENDVQSLRGELKEKQKAVADFNDEYPVEWPQYYLVSGGHFHNTLQCHSLRATTQVGLYPDASGLEEDEAIELAGSRVCTHCIPDAPVDIGSRPSHVWTKEEKEEIEAKERREEEKKRKEEEKKRKAEKRKQKQKSSGNALPVPMKPFTIGGFTPEYIDRDITTVTRMKKYLRAANSSLMSTYVREQLAKDHTDNSVLEHDVQWFLDNPHVENIDSLEDREAVLRNSFGTDNYWLAREFYGDITLAEKEFTDIHDAVQAISDTKNISFEKALDSFTSTRLLKPLKENIDDYWNDQRDEDKVNYTTEKMIQAVDDKTSLVREIIEEPSLVRRLLEK